MSSVEKGGHEYTARNEGLLSFSDMLLEALFFFLPGLLRSGLKRLIIQKL